jgi:hypothetical protein
MFNVGDEVAVFKHGYITGIHKVTRVTKKQVIVKDIDCCVCDRYTGIGEWHTIEKVTDKHRLSLKTRLVRTRLEYTQWRMLPDELILAIADILDQHEKNHGEGKGE